MATGGCSEDDLKEFTDLLKIFYDEGEEVDVKTIFKRPKFKDFFASHCRVRKYNFQVCILIKIYSIYY